MFAQLAPLLRHNGWRTIVPIMPGQKRPALGAWQTYNQRTPTDAEIERWRGLFPDCGVGFCFGVDPIIAADLDFTDPEKAAIATELLHKHWGRSPLIRIGKPPKSLALYRAGPGFAIGRKAFGGFEIFTNSGQAVLHGVHPATGKPYEWPDAAPETATPDEIPAVTREQVAALLDALAPYREAPAKVLQRARTATATRANAAPAGMAADLLPILRAAPDPLAEATQLVLEATPGGRHPIGFGALCALAMMGRSDSEIRRAVIHPYAELFFDACERAERVASLERALSWARQNIGPDDETVMRAAPMAAIAAAWMRRSNG